MANVLVRNISDEVLNRIKNIAKRHNRSLQQELSEAIENIASQSHLDVIQRTKDLRENLRRKNVDSLTAARCKEKTGHVESGLA